MDKTAISEKQDHTVPVDHYGYPLVLAEKDETVRIVSLRETGLTESRLISMGINPGAVLHVISSGGQGPIIVLRDEIRLAIDRKTAWRIRVVPESGRNCPVIQNYSVSCRGCSYRHGRKNHTDFSRTTLEQLKQNQEAKVVTVRRGGRARKRLETTGIETGTIIKVTKNGTRPGPITVEANGQSIILGHREAKHIEVEVLNRTGE